MDIKESESMKRSSVSAWLRLLPAGDRKAQQQLYNRYRTQVVEYAQKRLSQLGVRSIDADDVAQEVFIRLFRRAEVGGMPDLNNRDQLWLKLLRITGDCAKDARRKRVPATESAIDVRQDASAVPGLPQVADPKLDECLQIVEHILMRQRLAERHPDLPEIVRLKIQGHTVQEIADQLEVPKRTIERRLGWINQICDEYAAS